MAARSSLLRRPTPGARPARRTSPVVAALAAPAPRLVRLAHYDYPDRLLGHLMGRPFITYPLAYDFYYMLVTGRVAREGGDPSQSFLRHPTFGRGRWRPAEGVC